MRRTRPLRDDAAINDAPILICYDGSDDAAGGIETVAKLLGARRTVVLDIG